MAEQLASEYILGIDLGSNSLGWAIVGLIDDEPAELLRAGSRVFEAGMEGDLQSGREESRNLKRREARGHRRLLWRRRRRLTKLFNLLQRFGLLPHVPAAFSTPSGNGHRPPILPEQRQDLLNELDKQILSSAWFQAKAGLFSEPMHTMPYILRASALDEPLEPYFLGRAIYHLAQRRGFWSNRKQAPKKDDDEGVVKKEIGELRARMEQAGARTLGEYFSRLGPSVGTAEQQIRGWHTHRDMLRDEFEKIWDAQAAHHPDLLTSEREKQVYNAIFYQRPLWFDRNTIGQCELEPRERRAPRSSFVAQRFRLLQAVNNLRLERPEGSERVLTPRERDELVQELEIKGDRTYAQVRKLLKLPKEARFTIERGGEKTLRGNRTTAKFYEVFGERWLEMSAAEHDQALHDVLSIQKADGLQRRAVNRWKLDDESAKQFAGISPEPDYFNLSRKATEKLLPLLEIGATYAEARKELYPESFKSGEARELLPPVERTLTEIRNPAVMRSLTELRKVVNAIIRQHGKPQEIHVELARDLKKSKKQRQSISDNNRRNEKSRAEAAQAIIAGDVGINEPKPDDIRRFQLAEECRWMCPYSGRSISMRSLFGHEPQFDIEHIIPFSHSMDNSFQNLTLCYVPENRSVKGDKTPWQAYHGDPEKYEAILDRVGKLSGDRQTVAAKLKRFTMNDEELEGFLEDFRNRQLNDTAYGTSLAAKYLGVLYGGMADADGKRRVQATSGQATSYFRGLWKLNSILNDGPSSGGGYKPKSREDHRHHAVDAVVIGLTNAAMIKRLSDAAQRAPLEHRRRFATLQSPWPNFTDTVRGQIDKIVVSHRVSKKVSGALHEETLYSPPLPAIKPGGGDTAATAVRVRKPLAALTKNEVEDIADERVKALVKARLNGGDPKKVFASEANLPFFQTSDGRRIPIKRVRITKPERPTVIGRGRAQRHVISGNNHHVEIYAELDREGKEKEWGGEVVPMSEAYQRLKRGKPVVQRDFGPLVEFKFSLAKGDTVELQREDGEKALYVVKKLGFQVSMVSINDARRIEKYFSPRINGLSKRRARKVVVSPLGEIAEAHD